ncbi:putative membrane protein [Corynebacterium deserti GIMN1.010]|uniref:Putative membrane protein n=1 Tax=Corynebacterium deserti GIMN1.010 TaxID=931089 RepID=A0A0M3Q939_9CORY|nr:hypothetical protein [Corynebacterium deserti]ALC04953.1 putative membrane protein [Corynebacterium deserti GIMN1.010]
MDFATLFGSLVDVTLVGILLGAGLPALFALGIRFAHAPSAEGSNAFGKIASTICFAIIVVAIIAGILWITKSTIYQYSGFDIFGTEG